MSCSRCGGHMIEDQFLDMEGAYRQMWTTSWRCVNCGRVHDSVIEQNRLAHQQKPWARSSGVPEDQEDEVHHGTGSIIRRAA